MDTSPCVRSAPLLLLIYGLALAACSPEEDVDTLAPPAAVDFADELDGRGAKDGWIDLTPLWNTQNVLRNPDKGWFHHLFDEHASRYPVAETSDLTDVPGVHHQYIRVPWSELEPAEGQYNWKFITDYVDRWRAAGIWHFVVHVECSVPWNPDYEYGAPKWLEEYGVGFQFYKQADGYQHYEPDWENRRLSEKMLAFHEAFAERFADEPWLYAVDMGSYGDYGEGHVSFSGNEHASVDRLLDLMRVYTQAYPGTPIQVSEDYAAARPSAADRQRVLDFITANGLWLRDDSILVDYWLNDGASDACSVAEPEWFWAAAERAPTVIEMEHRFLTEEAGNWVGANGAQKGADDLRCAVEIIRPSFISWHGDAKSWYEQNPDITGELANRMGYWYFPAALRYVRNGQNAGNFELVVENRGVARSYKDYNLEFSLLDEDNRVVHTQRLPDVRTTAWEGSSKYTQTLEFDRPPGLSPGRYQFWLYMTNEDGWPIKLGLKYTIRSEDGAYNLGYVDVE